MPEFWEKSRHETQGPLMAHLLTITVLMKNVNVNYPTSFSPEAKKIFAGLWQLIGSKILARFRQFAKGSYQNYENKRELPIEAENTYIKI